MFAQKLADLLCSDAILAGDPKGNYETKNFAEFVWCAHTEGACAQSLPR